MSNRLLTLVWGAKPFGPPRIGPSMRLVLAALADQANDADGHKCYPSLHLIQQRTEMGRRTVLRALAAIKEGSWLKVGLRAGYGNEYVFDVKKLEEAQRAAKQRGIEGTRAFSDQ